MENNQTPFQPSIDINCPGCGENLKITLEDDGDMLFHGHNDCFVLELEQKQQWQTMLNQQWLDHHKGLATAKS